ncbi:hypothetical protein ACFLSA_07060, partial [Bacteroidota bacterium]
ADDTIRTLICSEIACHDRRVLEFTNLGDNPVNLSDFKAGVFSASQVRPPFQCTEGRKYHFHSVEIGAGKSFAFVWVRDPNPVSPDLMKKGYNLYLDESPPGPNEFANAPGHDSIDPFYAYINQGNYVNIGASSGFFVEYHTNIGQPDDDSATTDIIWYNDPDGVKMDVAGIPNGVRGYLVRKSNVTTGSTDWDKARGTTFEDGEWIPLKGAGMKVTGTQKWMTTLGVFEAGYLVPDSLKPLAAGIEVDWDNNTMTIPWGFVGDSLMWDFYLGQNMGWYYKYNADPEAMKHHVIQTGDTLIVFAINTGYDERTFVLEQGPAQPDMAKVFPKYVTYQGGPIAMYQEPWFVYPIGNPAIGQIISKKSNGVIPDTIFDMPFACRIDSLFKYIEKAEKASWEVLWVDGVERADLKYGDILKVTAEDEVTTREYFLKVDSVPAEWIDPTLSSITWPDAPQFIRDDPAWNDDLIPDFNSWNTIYTIKVPYGMATVPPLVATPFDLNARVDVEHAKVVRGTAENRTTTFTVTATDDTTIMVYKVIFEEELPKSLVQPVAMEPVLTQVTYGIFPSVSTIEIANPGSTPLDMSNYMITLGRDNETPAEAILNGAVRYRVRYGNYIPGYKYIDDADLEEIKDDPANIRDDWLGNDGLLEKDLRVNPILAPGDVFCHRVYRPWNWLVTTPRDKYYHQNASYYNRIADIMWTRERECDYILEDPEYWSIANTPINWVPYSHLYSARVWLQQTGGISSGKILVFKILNDSIKAGTKPVGDPEDFELIEIFGEFTSNGWAPAADTLANVSAAGGMDYGG